jgi:glutathione S-transferase
MASPAAPERLELITIPVSHYCEKVRWALEYLDVPFVERPHMPPFHRSATKRNGGGSVPVLVTASGPVTDSDAILRWLDQRNPGRLYPSPPGARGLELDALFNDVLGVHTRRWGYSYILSRELLRQPWTHGVPFWERWLYPVIFPKLEPRLRAMIGIDGNSAAASLLLVNGVFDQVGSTLADGRPYLMGEQFSGLDITFAALAAPLLGPPEHPVAIAPPERLPPQMLADRETARATAAGQFGLRLYREHRRRRAA